MLDKSTAELKSTDTKLTITGWGFDSLVAGWNKVSFTKADGVTALDPLVKATCIESTRSRLVMKITHLSPRNAGPLYGHAEVTLSASPTPKTGKSTPLQTQLGVIVAKEVLIYPGYTRIDSGRDVNLIIHGSGFDADRNVMDVNLVDFKGKVVSKIVGGAKPPSASGEIVKAEHERLIVRITRLHRYSSKLL